MSLALFSRNRDLKRLRDEGYFVQQRGGYLVMRDVPYADAHLPMRIDIGHLSHDEMPALLQDEVAFVAQPPEVWITTEQCA